LNYVIHNLINSGEFYDCHYINPCIIKTFSMKMYQAQGTKKTANSVLQNPLAKTIPDIHMDIAII